MAAKNDFLLWDDLPLEFLLGEFTESDEGLSEKSSDSTDEDNLVENRGRLHRPTKRPPTTTSNSNQENEVEAQDAPARKKPRYQCPDCSKGYLSISGFRGHMAKKHSKPSTRG